MWMVTLDRLADGLAALRPVQIDPHRCLPHRSHRATCNACAAICPEGAIDLANPSVNDCSACGLCARVCTADAILVENPSSQELLQRFTELARRTAVLQLTCRFGPKAALSVGCLGRLEPELLLAAAACGFAAVELVVDPAACRTCRYSAGAALWEETVTTVRAVLAHLRYPCRIGLVAPSNAGRAGHRQPAAPWHPPAVEAPLYEDRRAFLLTAFGLLRAMLPFAPAEPAAQPPSPQPSRRREILRWAAAHLPGAAQSQMPWGAAGVRLEAPCHRCGVCEQLCPNGAIRLAEAGLTLDPTRCHACGLCTRVCPTQALRLGEPRTLAAVTGGPPETLGSPGHMRCSQCGEEVSVNLPPGLPPGERSLCLACAIRRQEVIDS
jgi:ferredoxin